MMQEDTGLSLADGGRLAAANYVGYLAGALWAMVQPARTDHAVRASLAITAAATVAMAFADDMLAYLALRALAGVSSAWVLIHVSSWCAARLAVLGRPALNGVVFAGVGAGIVFAGALCIALMTLGAGSRMAWLLLGVAGFLVTAALGVPLERSVQGETLRQEHAVEQRDVMFHQRVAMIRNANDVLMKDMTNSTLHERWIDTEAQLRAFQQVRIVLRFLRARVGPVVQVRQLRAQDGRLNRIKDQRSQIKDQGFTGTTVAPQMR